MNMTDHKYPHEVTSCHNMLKKRDAIIDQLQAEKQPSVDNKNLLNEFDRCHEELGIYKRDNETLKKTIDELERGANLKYENRIEELEQANTHCGKQVTNLENQIAENKQPADVQNVVLLKNQIAEQKRDILAHMNKIDELLVEVKDYRTLQSVLKKVLDNGD